MPARFALEAVYAGKGDALILHHGTTTSPRWILIDGGHRKVYANYLRPRLEELRVQFAGKLRKTNGKIPLDLVMVSHADADHVQGLLDLKRHLEADNAPLDEPAVTIAQMWVNGFDDLAFGELTGATQEKERKEAGVQSVVADLTTDRDDDLRAWVASTGQCRELRTWAMSAAWQIPINSAFGGQLVRRDAPGHSGRCSIVRGLSMTVIGPDEDRIEKLRAQWGKDLEKILDREAKESAFADSSRHNLASIMVMVERAGKKMLLTGDARGDHLLEGLEAQGYVKNGRVDVDLFKLPHHGSSRNAEDSTFETIVAPHYVISANGEHDNPDTELLQMLADGREKAEPNGTYHVHFTFPERAFEQISEEDADAKKSLAKQREALLAVDRWLNSKKRPKNFVPVFRQKDRLSVTVDLLG